MNRLIAIMMLVSAAVIGLIVVTWRRRGRASGRDGSAGDFAADFGGGHGHHSGQDHSGASGSWAAAKAVAIAAEVTAAMEEAAAIEVRILRQPSSF
jgi:hypothetical protein